MVTDLSAFAGAMGCFKVVGVAHPAGYRCGAVAVGHLMPLRVVGSEFRWRQDPSLGRVAHPGGGLKPRCHNSTSAVYPSRGATTVLGDGSSVHALKATGELGKGDDDNLAFVPRAGEHFPSSGCSPEVIRLLSQAAYVGPLSPEHPYKGATVEHNLLLEPEPPVRYHSHPDILGHSPELALVKQLEGGPVHHVGAVGAHVVGLYRPAVVEPFAKIVVEVLPPPVPQRRGLGRAKRLRGRDFQHERTAVAVRVQVKLERDDVARPAEARGRVGHHVRSLRYHDVRDLLVLDRHPPVR